MAGKDYRLRLDAEINSKMLEARLRAFEKENSLNLSVKMDLGNFSELQQKLNQLRQDVDKNTKLDIFSDPSGKAQKAMFTYEDSLGRVVKETLHLQTITDNTGKIISEKWVSGTAKVSQNFGKVQKDMERMSLEADKFLERAKNLQQSPQVIQATGVAKSIKDAISQGDVSRAKELSKELKTLDSGIRQAGHSAWSFGEQLKTAFSRTIQYGLTIGIINEAITQLKAGVQYITDLNKEMTNIQLVSGATDKEISTLAKDYNKLAIEMGATTIEVAKGSLEWTRQGKTAEETAELLKSTLMLSKLGAIESAQATEYLTAITNGFKLEAEDTVDIIDKLVAVDNASATSVAEMSTALQRSSVTAQQAGVSFEELVAMEAVVSSTSRRAAESIGESFKTIFTRYQDIKEGRLDEDEMGINNVDDALKRVGVTIRDDQGQFRDFTDVLEDLYPVWRTLDSIEKANIAKALAGTRQRESLLILLENETKYRDLILKQQQAEGLANDRYQIYLDNIEASQNKATAAWEGLWQTMLNSDAIKFFYDLSAAVLTAITNMGGIYEAARKLSPIFFAMYKTQYDIGTSLMNMIKGFQWFSDNAEKIRADFLKLIPDELKNAIDYIVNKLPLISKAENKIKSLQKEQTFGGKSSGGIDESKLHVQSDADVVSEESKKAYQSILDMTVKMIKQRKNAEKDALKDQLDSVKESARKQLDVLEWQYDEEKRLRNERKQALSEELADFKYYIEQKQSALKEEYDAATRAREAEKDALKVQLDSYNRIIDAQITALNNRKQEVQYAREIEDTQESMTDLQNKIINLSLDDSAEAVAQRMELEQELAEMQKELAEDVEDHQIDLQISALEQRKATAQEEYDLKIQEIEIAQKAAETEFELKNQALEKSIEVAEREYDLKVRVLEQEQDNADYLYEINKRAIEENSALEQKALEDKIKLIEKYLDEEGTMNRDAMDMIAKNSQQVYQDLLEWNKKYGDGINETITNAWKMAKDALNEYLNGLSNVPLVESGIKAALSNYNSDTTDVLPSHHTGIDSGLAGGLKPNELIVKATDDEYIFKPEQLQNLIRNFAKIPEIRSTQNDNPVSVTIPITVQGNLDKNVLPDLERMVGKVVEKLNQNVLNRGYVRETSLTGI